MDATTSCRCGNCRRFCLGECALPRSGSAACEHFEHYGQWIRKELAWVDRHHRQTIAAAVALAVVIFAPLILTMLARS
jgi:hypothetical protein